MPSFLGKDSYSSSIILGRVFSTNSKKGGKPFCNKGYSLFIFKKVAGDLLKN
jgi:hypothetical protein